MRRQGTRALSNPAERERVVLEGRLHPSTIVLHVLLSLRKSFILLLILGAQVWRGDSLTRNVAVMIGSVVVIMMFVRPVVSWLRYRYRLTDQMLQVTSGLLFRVKERKIPVARIQDLTTEESVLRRMFGLVVLTVQTASTEGAEATLDSITRADADALRAALRKLGGGVGVAAPDAASGREPAPLIKLRVRDLVFRGLTDIRAGLVLASGAALFERALDFEELGLGFRGVRDLSTEIERLAGSGDAANAILLAAVIVVVLAAGWIVSAALSVIRFFGFAVVEVDGVFRRRYGLFTRRVHSLPRARIQAVRVEQTLVRRFFGIGTLRTDDMGSAMGKAAERSGTDVFVPVAPLASLEALVPVLLPGVDPSAQAWQRTSPRIVLRHGVRGLMLGGLIAAVAWDSFGLLSLAALGLVLPALLLGQLRYRRLAWADDDSTFALRSGALSHKTAFVPASRIQGVVHTRSPIERLQGLATVTVIVGGGRRVTLPNVPRRQAAALVTRLSSRISLQIYDSSYVPHARHDGFSQKARTL